MKIRFIVKFLFVALFLFVSVNEVSAQRKGKKDKGKVDVKEAPDSEDYRLAEYFLAEADKYFILEDYAKAYVLFQKSLEYDPDNAAAHYKISQIFVAGNELNKALGYAKRALEISPSNKYYYLQLAEIYTKQSDFASASEVYEKMLANTEDSDEYMFELAALYIYQDRLDDALKMYDKIEDRYGLNPQVIAQKQKLYIQNSNLEGAIKEGKKLIDAFPYEPDYVISLTEILISNNQSERAGDIIQESLEYNPGDARLQYEMSRVYRKLGEYDKAEEMLVASFGSTEIDLNTKLQIILTYINKLPNEDAEKTAFELAEKIIKAHPDEPDAHAVYGDIYMQLKKDSLAEKYYLEALDLGSTNYNIFQNLIQIESQQEDYKGLIKHAEKALEYYPNQPIFYFYLGMAYHIEGAYEDAIATLENGKILSGDNKQLEAYFNAQLGDAYNEVEAYTKSDEAYEAALAIDPNNDHVINNYAYFLSLRKEKLDLAKKMGANLVQQHPDNATYLDTYAWVLYQNGDYKEAKVYIEKAINVGSDLSGTILEHYGDILFKLGEVDSAVKQWQRAKGMDETSELIDKKIADRKLYE